MTNANKNDEFSELLRQIAPPARFKGYTPSFSVQRCTYSFNHAILNGEKPIEETLWVIKDGKRYVAYLRPTVEIAEGIRMVTFLPGAGPSSLDLPTGRLHHDSELGPTMQTCKGWFDGHKGYAIPPETPYDITMSGDSVRIIRMHDGSRTTVTISVDPVLGYCAEAQYDIREGIEYTQFTKAMGFGTYDPYPTRQRFSRTVFTPAGSFDYVGYYSNSAAIQSISNNSKSIATRDGGFIAFLREPDGWGYAFSRRGGGASARVKICDAHNVWHQKLKVPEDRIFTERLSSVPPEVGRYLCGKMEVYDSAEKAMLRIGVREDFSAKPRERTSPTRGIIISPSVAQIIPSPSGKGARLKISKPLESAIPQLCLEPCTKYRLDAVVSVTGGSARILGRFFEWSPKVAEKKNEWLGEFASESITPEQGTVSIGFEFTTPSWDPFLHLVVELEGGPAYMDEFYFRPLRSF